MLKRRLLSVLLALSMMLGISAQAAAAELQEAKIAVEVQAMEDEIYAEVYRQLEAQNGLHMIDTYMEILAPKIQATVEAKYTPAYSPFSINANWIKYAPNGGYVTYTKVGYVEVGELYMDYPTTQKYLIQNDKNILFCEILSDALGQTITEFWSGLIAQGFMQLVIAMHTVPRAKISACGGYAYIITTYEPTIPATYEVVLAWEDYPNIIIDRNQVHGDDPIFTPPKK